MSQEPLADWVERLVRPEIQQIQAYQVLDSMGLIKLDAMENPYPWPDHIRKGWQSLAADLAVNRYPDPQGLELKQTLRQAMQVPDEMEILLGNGSDEIIQMLVMALAKPGATLLTVEPGFVMYRLIALYCGMNYQAVALKAEDFSLDIEAFVAEIEARQPALIFLAYPNNPTGNLFERADLIRIIQASPGLVVIDEAYAPFTDESFLPLLGQYSNLLVMRTLSKMGLAGLRLGYLLGPAEWLVQIDKTRLPYNISVLSQAAANLVLQAADLMVEQTEQIRRDRQALIAQLAEFSALQVYPSEANFVLFRVPAGQATSIHQGLREAGVLIKKLDGAHPLLADCLRVTVGKPEENQTFLRALKPLVERFIRQAS